MADVSKNRSPFYPGQPVPPEFFVGRKDLIDRLMTRGAGQVAAGKPVAAFIDGEYGIGKSSLAYYVQQLAYRSKGLLPISTSLGGVRSLEGLATAVVEATVRADGMEESKAQKIREWLARYIGRQELFGVSINFDSLRADAPSFATPRGLLSFLGETLSKARGDDMRGVCLVLDEINGIASDPAFATFIKALIDTNAQSKEPIPLFLILCGTDDRRREMIAHHQPIDRIFDVVTVKEMTKLESEQFFMRAFDAAAMTYEGAAIDQLTFYSAGLPKIMQVLGDVAYWMDRDGHLNQDDAVSAVFEGAEEVGRKYVDQQVYAAINNADYRSILSKIATSVVLDESFNRADILLGLSDTEKKKLDNFLRRMENLQVIRKGETRGTYVFNVRMVQFYIYMKSQERR